MINTIKFLALAVFTLLTSFTAIGQVKMVQKTFFNEEMTLLMPEGFELMSEEMVKIKYPQEKEGAKFYTNENGTINVGIKLAGYAVNQDNLADYEDNFVYTFKRLYPEADWKGDGLTMVNGRKVGFLELVTPAVDTDIYNLMFFTDYKGKLLLCTFNCTKQHMEEWVPVAKNIMDSFKINL